MDKLEFIKMSLKRDLEYWKKEEKKNPDDAFYRGTVAGLSAFEKKIKFVLEERK